MSPAGARGGGSVLGCFPPRGDDLSGPRFPQLRDEHILAFLHKGTLTGLVASLQVLSTRFYLKGKASWNLLQRMKDGRADLGWRVLELGLFLPLFPCETGSCEFLHKPWRSVSTLSLTRSCPALASCSPPWLPSLLGWGDAQRQQK